MKTDHTMNEVTVNAELGIKVNPHRGVITIRGCTRPIPEWEKYFGSLQFFARMNPNPLYGKLLYQYKLAKALLKILSKTQMDTNRDPVDKVYSWGYALKKLLMIN